jgi:hypothetical protein
MTIMIADDHKRADTKSPATFDYLGYAADLNHRLFQV